VAAATFNAAGAQCPAGHPANGWHLRRYHTGRGKGAGSALLAAIIDTAKTNGLTKVTLDVIDSNRRTKALYEWPGFQQTGTENLGPLRHIFGFAKADKMVLDISQPEE